MSIVHYHIPTCLACNADLTQPDAVELHLSVAGREFDVPTRLEPDGALVDVDDEVASGHHAGSCCAACGDLLDEFDAPLTPDTIAKERDARRALEA